MTLLESVGKVRGHFASKENRAAKLLAMWDDLRAKLERMVVKGRGRTEQARHAYAVLVMMATGIRVGNEGSAEGFVCENCKRASKDDPSRVNPLTGKKGVKEGDIVWQHEYYGQTVHTFGLTTLRPEHVEVDGGRITLSFTGKKLVEQELVISDPILTRYRPPVPAGQETWLNISYPSLKRFVRRFVGPKFTPKDIRTAVVNRLFVQLWEDGFRAGFEAATRKSDRKRAISEAIEATAERIGHTKAVCKSSYLSGSLVRELFRQLEEAARKRERFD